MRLMRFILVFSLSLFALPETSQAQISYKNVSAQGVGVNLNNAINAALVEAISQVNGKSVESQQVLKTLETIKEGTSGNNYALQEDYAKQVATKTKGAIKSYTIEQQSRTADGRFQVTVNAQVAIYKRAKSSNRKRIALMPLRTRDAYRVNGANLNPLAVSEIVGQAVVDNLVSSRRFTVLDRDYMAELLSEEQLIQSSRVPVEEMARLGQTLAADMIFVGTLDHLNVGKRSRTLSSGRKIEYLEGQICEIEIDIQNGKPGFIVDGQQRLSALEPLNDRKFEVFVSAIICEDEEELRKQFILINNTKPLPKELIYELLPSVEGLPSRLSSRALGSHITTKLNYLRPTDDNISPFFGEIRQHTNPSGSISSTAVQKIVMNSRSHGALREFAHREDFEEKALEFMNNFFGAMVDLFPEAWIDKTPRNSRLKHSAGIISLGFVMEMAYSKFGAQSRIEFREVLECLRQTNVCAWTEGTWYFDITDVRQWDRIQNTQPDIRALSNHLVKIVRDQNVDKVSYVLSELAKGPVQSEWVEQI